MAHKLEKEDVPGKILIYQTWKYKKMWRKIVFTPAHSIFLLDFLFCLFHGNHSNGGWVYTVIFFGWVSAKFNTCTVVSVNGTHVEAKMSTFTLESTHFTINKSPIYTHDGASAKFCTNSYETDYSVHTTYSLILLKSLCSMKGSKFVQNMKLFSYKKAKNGLQKLK
jgi:hypothetical protein